MATGCATVNLGFAPAKPERTTTMLDYLLRFEYWLDNRSSSRELYRMNDHDLADIGLSKADVEGLNGSFWQEH
jgi:uncharacterized protein YjiS (DUF1127 family)